MVKSTFSKIRCVWYDFYPSMEINTFEGKIKWKWHLLWKLHLDIYLLFLVILASLILLYTWLNGCLKFRRDFPPQFTFSIFDYWGNRAAFEEIFIFLWKRHLKIIGKIVAIKGNPQNLYRTFNYLQLKFKSLDIQETHSYRSGD